MLAHLVIAAVLAVLVVAVSAMAHAVTNANVAFDALVVATVLKATAVQTNAVLPAHAKTVSRSSKWLSAR